MLDGPRIVHADIDRMGALLAAELAVSGAVAEHGYAFGRPNGPGGAWWFYVRGEGIGTVGRVLITAKGSRSFFDQMDAARNVLFHTRYDREGR